MSLECNGDSENAEYSIPIDAADSHFSGWAKVKSLYFLILSEFDVYVICSEGDQVQHVHFRFLSIKYTLSLFGHEFKNQILYSNSISPMSMRVCVQKKQALQSRTQEMSNSVQSDAYELMIESSSLTVYFTFNYLPNAVICMDMAIWHLTFGVRA